jgi:low affinity Fe/Cu permease
MRANAQSRHGGMPMLGLGNEMENVMSLGTVLLIILILMLVGVIPTWPHSQTWGYVPSVSLGVVVLVVLVLVLLGRL